MPCYNSFPVTNHAILKQLYNNVLSFSNSFAFLQSDMAAVHPCVLFAQSVSARAGTALVQDSSLYPLKGSHHAL